MAARASGRSLITRSRKIVVAVVEFIPIRSAVALVDQVLIVINEKPVCVSHGLEYAGISAFAAEVTAIVHQVDTAAVLARLPDDRVFIRVDVDLVLSVTVDIAVGNGDPGPAHGSTV